jgi:hypothetical protein
MFVRVSTAARLLYVNICVKVETKVTDAAAVTVLPTPLGALQMSSKSANQRVTSAPVPPIRVMPEKSKGKKPKRSTK